MGKEIYSGRYFARHAKSSALVTSLALHAVLLIVAISFVAVRVITKPDQDFEAKQVSRPRVKLRKLQVPVDVKKRAQKPKLRKRVVVQPKLNRAMPEIKLPEMTGVKGGVGAGTGTGLGGSSIGFSMPEMKLFGIKARGEKVYIILDASAYMMVDEMGGIPAYTIIKNELVRILEDLNSSVLFNIAIYGGGTYSLFESMVPASESNVARVEAWLEPLNAVSRNMGDNDYGSRTKGPGGVSVRSQGRVDPLKNATGDWTSPAFSAMAQQADIVFLLTCRWGRHGYNVSEAQQMTESEQRRWQENIAKARRMHSEENTERRNRGQPPRVIAGGNRQLVKTYLPGAYLPPGAKFQHYTPEEFIEAFGNVRESSRPNPVAASSGISKTKKDKYSIHVVHFIRQDSNEEDTRLSRMARMTRGDYRKIKGLKAIQSYVKTGPDD